MRLSALTAIVYDPQSGEGPTTLTPWLQEPYEGREPSVGHHAVVPDYALMVSGTTYHFVYRLFTS